MARKDEVPSDEWKQKAFSQVPIELQDDILRDVDFPFSMAEAKALRLELMEERKEFVLQNAEAFENAVTISLCKHYSRLSHIGGLPRVWLIKKYGL